MLSPAVAVELRKTLSPSMIKAITIGHASSADNSEIPQISQHASLDDENLPLPSGITKESYVTVECKIGGKTFKDLIKDTGSTTSFFSTETLAILGWKPTRKVDSKLKMADKSSIAQTIGWYDDVSVTIGKNPAVSITDNFLIIVSNIPMAVGGTPWIRRAMAKVDYKKLEMEISSHGNTISVPISVKKIENDANKESPLEVHFAEELPMPAPLKKKNV